MNKKYAGKVRTGPSQPTALAVTRPVVEPVTASPESLEGSVPILFPPEIQEEAKRIIERSFRDFADHSQRLAEDIADFNRKRDEVRNEIKRGARRTSGRIV